jgi:Zn-dependent M16 (insulinase) family peptidase
MNPLAHLSHEQSGLEGIRRLRALDDAIKHDDALDELLTQLQDLHVQLQTAGATAVATIGDLEHIDQAQQLARAAASQLSVDSNTSAWKPDAIRESRREFWVANTQVNFCAKAFPTVAAGHPDAPVLTVLAAFLRNGFLHRAIREQGGAYGGGASHDANIGAFRFFSYRDPRLKGTLNDFDDAVRWLINHQHEQLALEEAILGIIGSIDKPGSPAGEAKKHFHELLFDRTAEHRGAFRQGVINTSLDDLRRVAETYLLNPDSSIAVITSVEHARQEEAYLESLQLARRDLL